MDELVAGLGAYRLARLAVEDTIFDRQRGIAHAWLIERGWLKALQGATCGKCVSVWTAAVLTRPGRRWFIRWMAASGLACALWRLAEDGVENARLNGVTPVSVEG